MKKLLLCFMMIFSFAFLVQAVPVNAEEDQEITIYDMRSDYVDKLMPEELPRSYQIPGHQKGVNYTITSGDDIVKVSSSGEVTARKSVSMSNINGSFRQYDSVKGGDAKIQITYYGSVLRTMTVHMIDYGEIYLQQELQKYIDSNITEDMSDDELAEAIAKLPAGYDFANGTSKPANMIICGEGNAKACAETVAALAEKLGYEAWTQYTDKTVNKRMIAIVKIHDKYYQIDAGQNGSKDENGYRSYEIVSRTSLFRYEVMDDGNANITSYDGAASTGVVEVPSTIDGYTVTKIGWKGLAELDCTKIVLPDTLETLDYYAFSACQNLKEIELPASLTTIVGAPFEDCSSLETLTVAEESNTFMAEDNVVYSKDGTTLILTTMVSEFKVPDTVTAIDKYAFYNNTNLNKVEVPSGVTTIGREAFSGCSNLVEVQLSEGLKVIGEYCFDSDTNLTVIRFPSTVTNIAAYAFNKCSGLKAAIFCGDVPTFRDVNPSMNYDNIFYQCNLTAYYPSGNDTWDDAALNGYYSKHGASYLVWTAWDPENVKSIADAEVTLSQDSYVYTGEKCEPEVTVTLDEMVLAPGSEYITRYMYNVNAGTAFIQITGCGNYKDTIKKEFQIEKARLPLSLAWSKSSLTVGETIQAMNVSPENCQFSSKTPEIATVTTEGALTGVAPGTAVITVTYPGDENHLMVSFDGEITVNPDPSTVTPDPSTEPSDDPEASNTPDPFESSEPVQSPDANVPSNAPSQKPNNSGNSTTAKPDPTKAPGQSTAKPTTTKAPTTTKVPTNNPGNDDPNVTPSQKPNNPGNSTTAKPAPTKAPGQSTTKPTTTKAPTATKAPSKTNTGTTNTTTKGKTVTYKKAKYRITGAATVEFTQLVKGKTVTIPDTITVGGKVYKVTSIAAGACRDNTKITKLTIGKNVKKIGKEAFMNCKKLKNIVCKSTLFKAGSIKKNAFKGISSKVVLKTPKGKETMYKKWFAL